MIDNPIVKMLLKFAGLGTGATLALVVVEMWRAHPELLIGLATSWGPVTGLCFAGLWFVDRRFGEGVQVMRDNTIAQQRLADAVTQIAQKDDSERREQKLQIGYVAAQQEKILEKLEGMELKARGTHA